MASVIDITKRRRANVFAAPEGGAQRAPQAAPQAQARADIERRTRGLFASRITRLIFVCNFIGLLVLFIGVLFLSETRTRLTQAQHQSLLQQGELVANVIVASATSAADPEPTLNATSARTAIREVASLRRSNRQDEGVRIRLFDAKGDLIADTDVLAVAGRVDVRQLPPPGESVIARSVRALGHALANIENWRITPWRPTMSVEAGRQAALSGRDGSRPGPQ